MYRLSNRPFSRFLLLLALWLSSFSWLPAAAQPDTSRPSSALVSAPDSGIPLRHAAPGDDAIAQQEMIGAPGRWELGSALLAPDPNAPAVVVSGHITGVVTASGSGLPLSGADVWLYRPDGTFVYPVQTDAQGVYQFPNVLSGTYKVRFDGFDVGPGYGAQWYNGQASLNAAADLSIAENATAANINAVLAVGGHITGTLTGADSGLPLQGVRVRARDGNNFIASAQSVTDAAGHYDIAGISTGSYGVQFFPPGFSASSMYLPGDYHGKSSL